MLTPFRSYFHSLSRLLAGPIIITGVALAIAAISKAGAPHLDDDHKKWGIALFILYFAQLALGGLIHYVKPKSFTVDKKRPAQNYLHAVFGLLIIALAFYQVCLSPAICIINHRCRGCRSPLRSVIFMWSGLIVSYLLIRIYYSCNIGSHWVQD